MHQPLFHTDSSGMVVGENLHDYNLTRRVSNRVETIPSIYQYYLVSSKTIIFRLILGIALPFDGVDLLLLVINL